MNALLRAAAVLLALAVSACASSPTDGPPEGNWTALVAVAPASAEDAVVRIHWPVGQVLAIDCGDDAVAATRDKHSSGVLPPMFDGRCRVFDDPKGDAAFGGANGATSTIDGDVDARDATIRLGGLKLGAIAIGAFALGAFAIGALAIGALAIGRLRVRDAQFGKVRIEELEVGRLVIEDDSRA